MADIKLKNTANTEFSISHNGTRGAKAVTSDQIVVAVETINDFPANAETGDTVIVKDNNRGGTFIYEAAHSAVNNGGTIFDGWVRQYSGAVNVKWFGASVDRNDNEIPLQDALDSGFSLFFPAGIYEINDTLHLYTNSSYNWTGEGANKTILKFTNTSISYGISRIGVNSAHWFVDGITFSGMGKDIGAVTGISSTDGSGSNSYNLKFHDVYVSDFSGNGIIITDWFQQQYSKIGARNIGGDAIVLSGDQFLDFDGTGNFFTNIDGYCLWFQGGSPNIRGVNIENCKYGIQFGRDTSHQYGASYCFPDISGVNIEYIVGGGTGLYFNVASLFQSLSSVSLYADSSVGAPPVEYGIYIAYLGGEIGRIESKGVTFNTTYGGSFNNKIHINSKSPSNSGAIDSIGNGTADFDGAQKSAVITNKSKSTAWVSFVATSGTPVILDSYNVYAVTKVATGRFKIEFASLMLDSNYSVSMSCYTAATNTTGLNIAMATNKTTQYLDLNVIFLSPTYSGATNGEGSIDIHIFGGKF